MKFGTLVVMEPGGRLREIPIEFPSFSVGQRDDNVVVLPDPSVSPRHAHLVIDSGNLLVTDLGSESGTFVAGERIEPGKPALVQPGQSIRFGNVETRYELASEIERHMAPPGASAAPLGVAGPLEHAPVRVVLSPASLSVVAGGAAQLTATIYNRGSVVDELTVSVTGVPPDWVTLSSPTVALVPGNHESVTISVRPPRRPEATAGEHLVTVGASSATQAYQATANATLTIPVFESTTLTLKPAQSSGKFLLVARSAGNAPARYTLSGVDDEEKLRYRFAPPTLELPGGQERDVEVRVRTRRRLRGRRALQPFRLLAHRSPNAGAPPLEVQGRLTSKALLGWLPGPLVAFIAAALGLTAVGGLKGARGVVLGAVGLALVAGAAVGVFALSQSDGGSGGTPTPVIAVPTNTPSPTNTVPPTNTPTTTPSPTPTSTPTNTPKPTPTNTPTNTPKPTPTSTPTDTPKPTPTNTPIKKP